MTTQRVNAYKSGDTTVFYIEQYDTHTKEWLTVGDTYDELENALTLVNNHNLIQLVLLVTA